MILNALVLFGALALDRIFPDFSNSLALRHWASPDFRPYQFVTSMFMHGDLFHLLGNMIALWIAGSFLERSWGPKFFLSFYFVCGLGAALIYLGYRTTEIWELQDLMAEFRNTADPDLFRKIYQEFGRFWYFETNRDQQLLNAALNFDGDNLEYFRELAMPSATLIEDGQLKQRMVGASGAIYGVMLAFGLIYWDMRFQLLFPPIPVKVGWLVIFYGISLGYSLLNNNPYDNTAHWAHFGGVIFGYLLLKIFRLR